MNAMLVPTDFSSIAENAANYAAPLCKELGAKLILLHVYTLPLPVSEIPYVMVPADEMQKASENAIIKEAKRIFDQFGIEVEWLVRLGLASDEIRDIESEENIELIVMGMNGAGEFDKLIGSATIAVIRKSRLPVLVIPEEARYTLFESIAYATDFSYSVNMSCFTLLKFFIKIYKSKLIIVNVQKNGKLPLDQRTIGREKLEQVLTDIDHEYVIMEDNNIEHGLQQFIELHSPKVLTMIAHKHNMLERLFGTHHTREMIYHTHIPILILQNKD